MRGSRLLGLVYFILLVSLVSAAPQNPEEYWGYVYVGNELAEVGNILSVHTQSGELLSTQTIPIDANYKGSYHIAVNFDDPSTIADEGTINGETLIWKLNNITVNIPKDDKSEVGKANDNYVIRAIINPRINLSIKYSNLINYGENIKIITDFKNTAQGGGKILIETDEEKFTKKSEGQLIHTIKPNHCGEYNEEIIFSIYNDNNEVFENISKNIKTNVEGYDLSVEDLKIARNTIFEDEENEIVATIKNRGEKKVESFSVSFYLAGENRKLIKTVKVESTINPKENIPVTINWEVKGEGNQEIEAVVEKDNSDCINENNNASIKINIIGKKVKVVSGTIRNEVFDDKITGKTIEEKKTVEYIAYEEGSFNISKKLFWIVLAIISTGIIFNLYIRRNYTFTVEKTPEPPKQKIKIIREKDNSFETFRDKVNNMHNAELAKSNYTFIKKEKNLINDSIKNKASLVPFTDIKEVGLLIQLIQSDKKLKTEFILKKYLDLGYQPHVIHYSLNAVRHIKHKSPVKFDVERRFRRLGVYSGMQNITKGQLQKAALVLAEYHKK